MKAAIGFVILLLVTGCSSHDDSRTTTQIFEGAGFDGKAPSNKPAGKFTSEGVVAEDDANNRCTIDGRRLDRRMKAGQSFLEKSDYFFSTIQLYFHSSRRTKIHEVNFSEEMFVRTVESLAPDGSVVSWIKERCKVPNASDYSFECKMLDGSEDRKRPPKEEPESEPDDKTTHCYFDYDYDKDDKVRKFEKGQYSFSNGPQTSALRIEIVQNGHMKCKTGKKESVEGAATETSVSIYVQNIPEINMSSCENLTQIFNYSKVVDNKGKVRDVSKSETLRAKL